MKRRASARKNIKKQMTSPVVVAFFLALMISPAESAQTSTPSCRHIFTAPSSTIAKAASLEKLKTLFFHLDRIRFQRLNRLNQKLNTDQFDLELGHYKRMTSQAMIEYSLAQAAKERNEVIIIRPINPAALEHLERSVLTKPMEMISKTAREGDWAGLVLTQGGQPAVVGKGQKITSDIDVWDYLRQTPENMAHWDPQRGWQRRQDDLSLQAINRAFKSVDRRSLVRDLIQHGPWNAHPELSRVESDYPLTAVTPNGELHVLRDRNTLRDFLHEWNSRGFQ